MTTHRTRFSLCAASLALGLAALLAPEDAKAEGYATPPGGHSRTFLVREGWDDDDSDTVIVADPRGSTVRLFVGPGGRLSSDGAGPGMLAALELGRGPTGFRLSAGWMDVGADTGLSQYTGELTIDFGGRSRFRPVIGAGGGAAITSASLRDDGSLDPERSAVIGVGVVRAGLGIRLPLEEADARVSLDLTGTIPAVRARSAPDLNPWVLASLMVGVGF
ncbi:MAG TPA: hypothetical protein VE093_48035 [Polyangiaceae bacterium]|jgi:hypothetical protein|nr:hypothetical protein [Polyangiaceae bacterium]